MFVLVAHSSSSGSNAQNLCRGVGLKLAPLVGHRPAAASHDAIGSDAAAPGASSPRTASLGGCVRPGSLGRITHRRGVVHPCVQSHQYGQQGVRHWGSTSPHPGWVDGTYRWVVPAAAPIQD